MMKKDYTVFTSPVPDALDLFLPEPEDPQDETMHAQPHCETCGCDLHEGLCPEGHKQGDDENQSLSQAELDEQRYRSLSAKEIRGLNTPPVLDARKIMRALGVVDCLLRIHRGGCTAGETFDLVEEALIRLGVTSKEMLANFDKE